MKITDALHKEEMIVRRARQLARTAPRHAEFYATPHEARFRGDGFDGIRMDAAAAKRGRR